MGVILKKGDLLDSDCDLIIHQANCFVYMGGGIAKKIKKKFPVVFEADKQYKYPKGDKRRLGNYSYADVNDKLRIVNMYSQYNYGSGKQTDYIAFEKSLSLILSELSKGKGYSKIGVPLGIGCGRAGGDWIIVEGIIEKISKENNVDIYTYQLESKFKRMFSFIIKKRK